MLQPDQVTWIVLQDRHKQVLAATNSVGWAEYDVVRTVLKIDSLRLNASVTPQLLRYGDWPMSRVAERVLEDMFKTLRKEIMEAGFKDAFNEPNMETAEGNPCTVGGWMRPYMEAEQNKRDYTEILEKELLRLVKENKQLKYDLDTLASEVEIDHADY